LGVGVVEVVENVDGLLPDLAGGVGVASGVVGVAEVDERAGDVEGIAEVPGVLVARDGLGVVAEVVVGVAEAVPGGGWPGW